MRRSFLIILSLFAYSVANDEEYQCRELIQHDASTPGEVASPFYGVKETHPSGLWCEYRIFAPENHRIRLTFQDLDIRESVQCREDKLYLLSQNRTVLELFCGSDLPQKAIISLKGENEMRLLFLTSSKPGGGRGFKLHYDSILDECSPDKNLCMNGKCFTDEQKCDRVDHCGDGTDEEDCGYNKEEWNCRELYEHDASKKGIVSSPFYGLRTEYHNWLYCEHRIFAPQGHRIKLTFKDMDIDPSTGCGQDNIIIYSMDKSRALGAFCGHDIPRPVMSVEGENEVRIIFRSDYMAGGRGFLLEYESGPGLQLCESGTTECKNRNCYKSDKKCDGVDDCGDGTDEEDCGFPIALEPKECSVQEIRPDTLDSPDRVVGGEEAVPNSWPWQVSLQYNITEPNGHFCGGTLINAQWVLTASHCIATMSMPGQIRIHLGSHGKFTKTPYEQVRRSAKVIGYPDLEGDQTKTFTFEHDMALIKMNAPVQFTKGVQPACLPQLGWGLIPGSTCYVTGWGETRGSGSSDALKQLKVNIFEQDQCVYKLNDKSHICVGAENQSPCHGDSGGPLSCKIMDKYYVFGATSFATTTNFLTGLCTGKDGRAVYANSADKADWIKYVIQKYT